MIEQFCKNLFNSMSVSQLIEFRDTHYRTENCTNNEKIVTMINQELETRK